MDPEDALIVYKNGGLSGRVVGVVLSFQVFKKSGPAVANIVPYCNLEYNNSFTVRGDCGCCWFSGFTGNPIGIHVAGNGINKAQFISFSSILKKSNSTIIIPD